MNDPYCRGCRYRKMLYGFGSGGLAYCSYCLETGKKRPCQPGDGCTEWADKEERADARHLYLFSFDLATD